MRGVLSSNPEATVINLQTLLTYPSRYKSTFISLRKITL